MTSTLSTVLKSLEGIWQQFLEHLPLLVAGVLILAITWILGRILARVLRSVLLRTALRESLKELCRKAVFVFVWVAGLLVSAMIVFPGMTPGRVLSVLGLGSIAIGFAFKDIFENFFAGILILWRFPFDPGDYIECSDILGKVEEISVRDTLIRQTDGQVVIVPNALLFTHPVKVLTNLDARRVTVICGVAYGEDVDHSREVIRKTVEACDTVRSDHPVQIFAQEFASSSINFEVTWWTGSAPVELRRSRDQVVAAIKRALDEANIEIPFPYRTLTFKEPLKTTSVEERARAAGE